MAIPLPAASVSTAAEDDGCMRRLQAGETDALGELFERHHRQLFQYFARLGAAPAEDLTQEVFVRVLKYGRSYRPGTQFRTWMYTIARNVRHTHLQRRRAEINDVSWDDAHDRDAPSFTPTDTAELDQQQRRLARALARLPEDKRELLVLARYQELDYAAIGALLGCSEGAVKVRVHRAVGVLRRHFLELAEGGNHDPM